jgi:hypothetical protein
MEVHHHPHVPTHSKPWKEYLLEGLMIFVAVTLGYGAENIREHYVETKKAIISAGNLYVDVLEDSVRYEKILQTRYFQDWFNSHNTNGKSIYHLAELNIPHPTCTPFLSTIFYG